MQRALQRKFPSEFVTKFGKVRAKVVTKGKRVPVIDACNRYQRGLAYKKIVNPAAKAIRSANPDAEILAGETSGNKSLDWFFKAVKPSSLNVDGWAHHPFQYRDLTPATPSDSWGIGNIKLLRKTVKMPVYLTEFGYPHPNSSMDKRVFGRRLTFDEIAKALPAAWKVARKGGAKQMLQYQWFQKPEFRTEYWDTSLITEGDGSTSAPYEALKKYINSW